MKSPTEALFREFLEARTLEQIGDRNLYLQEFQKTEIKAEDLHIKYFYEDSGLKIDLNIIYRDGTYYINAPENVKIKLIDRESEIKVIDSKKPVIRSEEKNLITICRRSKKPEMFFSFKEF